MMELSLDQAVKSQRISALSLVSAWAFFLCSLTFLLASLFMPGLLFLILSFIAIVLYIQAGQKRKNSLLSLEKKLAEDLCSFSQHPDLSKRIIPGQDAVKIVSSPSGHPFTYLKVSGEETYFLTSEVVILPPQGPITLYTHKNYLYAYCPAGRERKVLAYLEKLHHPMDRASNWYDLDTESPSAGFDLLTGIFTLGSETVSYVIPDQKNSSLNPEQLYWLTLAGNKIVEMAPLPQNRLIVSGEIDTLTLAPEGRSQVTFYTGDQYELTFLVSNQEARHLQEGIQTTFCILYEDGNLLGKSQK